MEVRLLGPMEVVAGNRSLDLGGRRQRVVLALLALNANRVTPVGQLIDAIWDTEPPATARTQIHTCISGLRKTLTDYGVAISTKPPGYTLEIPEDCLDSARFSVLTLDARAKSDDGDSTAATESLQAALDLWRGPALADIPSDVVQRKAALLDDRYRAAVEERLRLDLGLGRHEEVIEELRSLINEQPLREKLYEFLMLALYRARRQAEALEIARLARDTLVERIGIEPGQTLRALEHAILTNDPSLDLPVAAPPPKPAGPEVPPPEQQDVPRQLPASISDFAGRQEQIDRIKLLLGGDIDGDQHAMPIVSISGPGGVGKSILAVRVAQELRKDYPDGQLYASLEPGTDPDGGLQLARFLRALGVSGTAIPDDVAERSELYRSRLADKRVLVVLDNVPGEQQVHPLLPGNPACAVITTSRARLSGLHGAHAVHLDVFDTEQSLQMLAGIVDSYRIEAEREASVRLIELCNGLPLALRIAGARLASRPHWHVADLARRLTDEADRLDELTHHGLELRSNIDLSYRALSEDAQRLLRLLVVIQHSDFAGWAAAPLLDLPPRRAEDILESLVDAHMVDAVDYPGGSVRRYRLHDLIRVYARERLEGTESPGEQRAALGRWLGGWLSLAEHAHRAQYGGDYTILRCTAPRWEFRSAHRDVGDRIVGSPSVWWEHEHQSVVSAIEQAAAGGFDEPAWGLALLAVNLFENKGYFEDWAKTSRLACDAARAAGNRTGEAAMHYSLGTLRVNQKRLDESVEPFTKALELFDADGNRHGRGLVLRNAAFADRLRGNTTEMHVKYAEALDILHDVGDRIAEAHVLGSMAKIAIDDGDHETGRDRLDTALRICQETACRRVEAQVLYRFADLYRCTGDLAAAEQSLDRTLDIVRDSGDHVGEAYALHLLGCVQQHDGRPDRAQTTLAQALAVARRVNERWIQGQALTALGDIAAAAGNTDSAARHRGEADRIFAELRG